MYIKHIGGYWMVNAYVLILFYNIDNRVLSSMYAL